jgi:hypothetical protein
LAGETEVLGENLPQRHFVHHKIPHDRRGLEPRTAAVGKNEAFVGFQFMGIAEIPNSTIFLLILGFRLRS